jgi:hypothetical protein
MNMSLASLVNDLNRSVKNKKRVMQNGYVYIGDVYKKLLDLVQVEGVVKFSGSENVASLKTAKSGPLDFKLEHSGGWFLTITDKAFKNQPIKLFVTNKA